MKIIGKGKDNEFVLVATREEISNIQGKTYGDNFEPGTIITVNRLFEDAYGKSVK